MKEKIVIITSIIVAFLMTAFPLPASLTWYRPAWVLLVLLYWLMSAPEHVGIVAAFFIGLLMDLLSGTLLGFHALLFSCLAFVIVKFHFTIRALSFGQKTIMVMVVEALVLLISAIFLENNQLLAGKWHYWMPIFTTAFAWLWVWWILHRCQYR